MRAFAIMLIGFATSCAQPAVQLAPEAEPEVSLWPDGNPDGWQAKEAFTQTLGGDGVLRVANVEQPTLQYFAPAAQSEARPIAVVICPGGGYRILALNKEGTDVAEALAAAGIHAFVLQYRLPNPGEERFRPGLQDALRASELVRARQSELGIEAIGILGFSAGGHLAATAAAQTSRPFDFVSLVYPAYFLPSREAAELVPEVSPTDNPVPAFLVHALNDRIPARNSVVYAEHLATKKTAAELHLYSRGGHGFGLAKSSDLPVRDWFAHYLTWLRRQEP